jgi:hypothetical protein
MRLTLRNLLLYLDHQMAPADAEDFAEKIKQSEFATGLIERIRSVTRVRRMPAPKLDEKGLGSDANSIADYIENLLPPERIKEFDKLCLDSDMTLAEVASCHHILTLVLAQPVQPSDELRDRIYAVPQLAATASAKAEQAAAHPEPPVVAPPLPEKKAAEEAAASLATKPAAAEVPDYLRAGRTSSFWPIAATVAATFLIVALLLRSMGPFDNRHPLAKWLEGESSSVVHEGNDQVPPPEPLAPPAEPMPDETLNQTGGDVAMSEEPAKPVPVATSTEKPEAGETEEPASPPEKTKADTAVAANTLPTADVPEPKKPAATAEPKESPPAEPTPDETAPSVMEVGRYLSDEQVLGRYDPKMGVWMRVPPRALLVAEEPLLSFPAFRPQMAIGAGVQVTLAGEAAIRVLTPDAEGAPNLFVNYGRLLIVTDGKPGTRMRLNLAGLEGVLSSSTPGAEVAIDVHYYLPPGADPAAEHGPRVIEISALSGAAQWQEPEIDAVEIPASHAFTFVEKSTAEVRGPFKAPDWIDARPTAAGSLDRDTRIVLDRTLTYDRSLNLSLEERAEDRKVEVRSLAARCLIEVNRFGPALANLRDPRLASFWTYDAEALRSALARGPTTAGLVRKEIQGSREMDAALLYRLLVGYSPEQLAADGANELIEALEHPELDVRVLAFDNLWRITGAMFNYRPERKPELNRTAVLRFRERLKEGSLAYKAAPSPIPDRRPLGK